MGHNAPENFLETKFVAGQPRDLSLLRGELSLGRGVAFSEVFAGRQQLAFGSPRECLGAHAREHLERGAQLPAGVEAAPLAAQPLAVEEVCAGELQPQQRVGKPLDCFAIEILCAAALA